jgi:translation initiation factor 2A
MPAMAALYNFKGNKIHDFGKAARNTITWSPHGRFFAIAGFGSLQGAMDFYDHSTMKKIGHTSAGSPPTSWQWSPDSRCLLLATLFPRMRQGVGFEMYNYRGDILFREDCEELTQVAWQYCSDISYPDRPPSPGRVRAKDISVRKLAKKTKAISKGGKYVPPGRRNRSSETSKKYVPPGAKRSIPGLSPSIPGMGGSSNTNKNSRRRRKKKKNKNNNQTESEKVTPPAAPPVVVDASKEKRKIEKKLREIERLKSKTELNEAQKKKLSLESDLLKRLEELKLMN